MKKTTLKFLMGVFICVFLYSGYRIIERLADYKSSGDHYEKLLDYVAQPATTEPLHTNGSTSKPAETEPVQKPVTGASSGWPNVNFEQLRMINPEVVAWILCEGTKINYPVVQGKDNADYLNRHFNGRRSSAGCIFLDCRNQPQFGDTHSILYGHQVSDGSMFSALLKYKKQTYYEAHPEMLLITPDANYVIELVAGYVAKASESAWKLEFASQPEYEAWLSEAVRRSTFKSRVVPTGQERVITLSTCSYEFYNARYVVVGILRWHPK